MPGVYSYGAASVGSLATTIGLYALLTGSGEAFNVGKFLEQTSPYAFAMLGISFCIGLSVMGAGWGIFLTGIIFCEVVAIYGVIMAIVFSSKITGNLKAGTSDSLYSAENYLTGHLLFWGGLTVGLCNLVCGVAVGVTGANAAIADAADPQLFVKVLVLEIFGSILGLFGLIVGLIMTGPAQEFS
ncbi:unnamed protein product [Tilletia controversa]|uniref:V-ATPase proteolipid subunit C-like domain-containing protein n=1 Tax=Tilletia laevis TaxID=157183 RepID=A0A9N8M9Y6_9BASI|nr:unnamed protein product [Tilletia controversa]CAD6935998.1 unnamed protein product [Tilletia laevis]CAD6965156.1 unnamed protein product [Tilletia laevis]